MAPDFRPYAREKRILKMHYKCITKDYTTLFRLKVNYSKLKADYLESQVDSQASYQITWITSGILRITSILLGITFGLPSIILGLRSRLSIKILDDLDHCRLQVD